MSRACFRERLLMKLSLHHLLKFFSALSLLFSVLFFSKNSREARYTLSNVRWSPSGLEKLLMTARDWKRKRKWIRHMVVFSCREIFSLFHVWFSWEWKGIFFSRKELRAWKTCLDGVTLVISGEEKSKGKLDFLDF